MTNERILLAGAVLLLAVVAAVASQRLRLPLLITFLGLGMLLGSEGLGGIAVVGPTDAAAVFATLRGTTLRRRLASLLTAESGENDPAAVALTLGLISWIQVAGYGGDDLTLLLVRELGLGLAIGVALGFAVRHLPPLPSELAPFAPAASLGIAAVAYGIPASLHASGFEPGDGVYVLARSEARRDAEAVIGEWERRGMRRDVPRRRAEPQAERGEAT